MRIEILTLFTEMFTPLKQSILGRAHDKGCYQLNINDIREYSVDKHKKCDDTPFGGGAGMVMTPQPLYDAINTIDPNHLCKRIYMSPKGQVLNQHLVEYLALEDSLMFVCGHYEGIDQRIIDSSIDMELSIGDYVLTGGELPAMVAIDCILRYVDGVLGSGESTGEESFSRELLEYPHYTRPQVFMGASVPEILISGNHSRIDKWRRTEQLRITEKLRPDVFKEYITKYYRPDNKKSTK